MEYTEETEEWQLIEQHQSPEISGRNMVLINENYLSSINNTAIPGNQQGLLQILPTTTDPDGETSPAESSTVSDEEDATSSVPAPPTSDWRMRVANEGTKLLKMRFETMRAGVVKVASKVRDCIICTGAFWSITYVTGVAAAAVLVSLVYVGIQRRRRRVISAQSVDHCVYLLREKDEKISQLLLQIAQLNEVLSSRRKVLVHQIGS